MLLVVATPLAAHAASGPGPGRTFWGQVALGAAGAADSGFYAASVGVGLQARHVLLLGRAGSIGTPKRKRMEEAGVMIGLATLPGVIHIGGGVGLGVADDKRGQSELALPMEVQATWRFSRHAGVGARLFANINKALNFGGVTVAFQAGRLRP